ncbi:phosphatidate cytidylyltransferase [Amycolatopsis suaedae]|uniref:Phosphatidate cytidylyltransferase n=2 Tax=Amycolatopsis suaedae TaxID=2510978 RepID=A0A4Q7JEN6_9PSEU|nr:phosphatidate cytidylyltransferase [Amycolatopsis suaedae]
MRAGLVMIVMLVVGGALVLAFGGPELRRRWRTWLIAAILVCVAVSFGTPGSAVLAVGLGIAGSVEYARLVGLRPIDCAALVLASVTLPLFAWLRPEGLTLSAAALLLVLAVLPPLFSQDGKDGAARAARTAFGLLWLPVALTGFVLLGTTVITICVAVAFADIGGWCGGKALGRKGLLARPLSPLSPAKTWAGVLGSAVFAAVALVATGGFTVLLWLAVVSGCVVGDLLESMVKRGAGVKDTGRWVPGFGGLLDRIDSLLFTLILVGVRG